MEAPQKIFEKPFFFASLWESLVRSVQETFIEGSAVIFCVDNTGSESEAHMYITYIQENV